MIRKKYFLLLVGMEDQSNYKYLEEPLLFKSKHGAMCKVHDNNKKRNEYPLLFDVGPFNYQWDSLGAHPEYAEYVSAIRDYAKLVKKESKYFGGLSATEKRERAIRYIAPLKPSVPVVLSDGLTAVSSYVNTLSKVMGAATAATPPPKVTVSTSTSDDFNALAVQMTTIALQVQAMAKAMEKDSANIATQLSTQRDSIIGLGGVIKSLGDRVEVLGDRVEDLEHP